MHSNTEDWQNWVSIIKKYSNPQSVKSWWQVANSIIPYIGIWILMIYSLDYSYWITLGLSLLAAGFMTRIFIIFHDCGHGSFFKSERLRRIVGIITGGIVYTPYHKWHYMHMVHHRTVGDLDKRGIGDVMTLTVEEYKNKTPRQKLFYRLYRNPIILFFIAPFFLFTVVNRLTNRKKFSRKINIYTHLTNVGIILAIGLISYFIGFINFILIQIPILYFATVFGVWLFYVQHQFEDVEWERSQNRDFKTIAMNGSSYLKLPPVLQWFSGNIGFHHIHHLSPKIPNYNLQKCFRETPLFQKNGISILEGIKTMKYRLWDEASKKLLSFKEAGV